MTLTFQELGGLALMGKALAKLDQVGCEKRLKNGAKAVSMVATCNKDYD